VRSRQPDTPAKHAKARSRRYVAAIVFEASGNEVATRVTNNLMSADGAIWVSSPIVCDRAEVYKVLEMRLLGDGDLIVVTPDE
jgi:hypothetical protein